MNGEFVNYKDGRSVNDVLQQALAGSGNPDAIQEIMDDIDTLETAVAGKQDAGNYVNNGGAGYAAFSGAYLVCPKNGENITGVGIRTEYDMQEDGAAVDWILFNRETKRISHSVYNNSSKKWEDKAIYTADEDTGWQTLTGTGVSYRKKNGIVFLALSNNTQAQTASDALLGTLPEGFRPTRQILTLGTTNQFAQYLGLTINTNGEVRSRLATGTGTGYYGSCSFPV